LRENGCAAVLIGIQVFAGHAAEEHAARSVAGAVRMRPACWWVKAAITKVDWKLLSLVLTRSLQQLPGDGDDGIVNELAVDLNR
jgi:hypothetical protein